MRVIVCGEWNRLETVMVSVPLRTLAGPIAQLGVPVRPSPAVLLTVNLESSARPSSAMTVGRNRRLLLACAFCPRHVRDFTSMPVIIYSHVILYTVLEQTTAASVVAAEDHVVAHLRAAGIRHAAAVAVGASTCDRYPAAAVLTRIDAKLAAPAF
jgi:hypothetical protein